MLVDRAKVHANIASMQQLAAGAGVTLRPHCKTHKSVTIARWQLDAGASGVCCAKLAEAETFADAGIDDIRLPYPVNPANATRVLALARSRASLDHRGRRRGGTAMVEKMAASGRRLDVLIKVDVGFHRCGIDPDSGQAFDIVREVAGLPGVRLRGLLSHAGHGYLARSVSEIEAIADAGDRDSWPPRVARAIGRHRDRGDQRRVDTDGPLHRASGRRHGDAARAITCSSTARRSVSKRRRSTTAR